MSQRQALAQWIMAEAKKAGAQDASVSLVNSRGISLELRDGRIDKLQESLSSQLSLTLYVKGRYSVHTTCNVRKDALTPFIAGAVALTRHLAQDPHRRLPEPTLSRLASPGDLEVADAGYGTLTSERRLAMVREAEAGGRAEQAPLISISASWNDNQSEYLLANTAGFLGEEATTTFSVSAAATVKDGEKGRPEDYAYQVRHHLSDLSGLAGIGQEAVRRAKAKLGQSKVPSAKYEVLVENRVANRLLVPLLEAMTAASLHQKQSFLEGKLGSSIAAPLLTVMDEPFLKRGLGSRLFDAEAIAMRPRTLIEGGVMKGLLADNYYARKLGITPTGGASNLVLKAGTRTREAMVADMKRGLLVTGFIGGNANGTTGDFSYGVSGMLVEQGQLVRPFNEVNLTGNLLELWKALVEVGSDPDRSSSLMAPTLRFEGLNISGS